MDVPGAAHLHGGEEVMLAEMIARLGAQASPPISPSPITGAPRMRWPAMPRGRPHIVPPDKSIAAIAPLPIAALRLPRDMVDDLRRLGFDSVSDP